jgi:imidazolonepropionase-like amidohydrolase
MKFGGTSVADTDKIRNVARRMVATHETGRPTVGVVSAMGETTDTLAALAAAGGRIVWVGPDRGLEESIQLGSDATVLDAGWAAVVPGFVDAHTHLAFTGDRDEEIRQRLAGATYQQIAAAGGGIVRTVEATRAATTEPLPISDSFGGIRKRRTG